MAFAVFPHQGQPELAGGILEEGRLFGECVMAFACVDKHLYLSAQRSAISLCDIPF